MHECPSFGRSPPTQHSHHSLTRSNLLRDLHHLRHHGGVLRDVLLSARSQPEVASFGPRSLRGSCLHISPRAAAVEKQVDSGMRTGSLLSRHPRELVHNDYDGEHIPPGSHATQRTRCASRHARSSRLVDQSLISEIIDRQCLRVAPTAGSALFCTSGSASFRDGSLGARPQFAASCSFPFNA